MKQIYKLHQSLNHAPNLLIPWILGTNLIVCPRTFPLLKQVAILYKLLNYSSDLSPRHMSLESCFKGSHLSLGEGAEML